MTDEELDDLDAQMENLLSNITEWPWKSHLEHGIPMLYGADGKTAVGFTVYEETPSGDGCPEADANAEAMKKAPELAARVQELIGLLREERKRK